MGMKYEITIKTNQNKEIRIGTDSLSELMFRIKSIYDEVPKINGETIAAQTVTIRQIDEAIIFDPRTEFKH